MAWTAAAATTASAAEWTVDRRVSFTEPLLQYTSTTFHP